MNADLSRLQPYPFERLARLKAGMEPPDDREPILLSIGEPRHATPAFIGEEVLSHLHQLSSYPSTHGSADLRRAIADWLTGRFDLAADSLDPETQILPVNGTREALFAFAQAVVKREDRPLVLIPNPFYQIYEGAALLAGAEPGYLSCTEETGMLPDFDRVDPATWARCQLLYLCSPGNPTGAVIDLETLKKLISLAHEYDFVIAADECYSEIYFNPRHPPVGLLQAAARMGNDDFRRCVVFHSLSKRSNAPGLRSGFVAGDAEIIDAFFLYRTYHGCAMPLHNQAASAHAWRDEAHVQCNRALYREKFERVLTILEGLLPVQIPEAGFYLWPETPISDLEFVRRLYAEQNVTVLPGSFLSRPAAGINPGEQRVRIALVPPLDECEEAAHRISTFLNSL